MPAGWPRARLRTGDGCDMASVLLLCCCQHRAHRAAPGPAPGPWSPRLLPHQDFLFQAHCGVPRQWSGVPVVGPHVDHGDGVTLAGQACADPVPKLWMAVG